MFAGIIQGCGKLIDQSNLGEITIETQLDLSNCKIGSSINCDGICLTATSIYKKNDKYFFKINLGEETYIRTSAKFWNKTSKINIEKSLRLGEEIGGHFVYGHVDTISSVSKIEKLESSWNFYFSILNQNSKNNYSKFIVEKGSISINGISLTIVNVKSGVFNISIIPHTYHNTNLSKLEVGDSVNIEFDALARYTDSDD